MLDALPQWFNLLDLGSVEKIYFAQPWAAWLLLLLPVIFILWRNKQQQRLEQSLAFSLTAVVKQASKAKGGLAQLAPVINLLTIVGVLILLVAQPTILRRVPDRTVDMMLVMDISISMKATDMQPDRITSARNAAKAFVKSLPRDVRLGLVLFAGQSHLVAPPSTEHRMVLRYLDGLTVDNLQAGTAIGGALQTALQALTANQVVNQSANGLKNTIPQPAQSLPEELTENLSEQTANRAKQPQKVIVLMTDGDQQVGYPWQQAATNAKKQQAAVFTVGVGSKAGADIDYMGETFFVTLNDSVLKAISKITGGEYYRAFADEDFKAIYASVRERSVHWIEREDDLGFLLALLALAMMMMPLLPKPNSSQ